MRCFVALDVPPAVKKLLVQVQEALRRADADVKWVEERNLHLSLKFLGDLDPPSVASLQEMLSAEAPRWPKLSLSFGGIGAFPERGAPRIVWAGCRGDQETLAGLAGAVERLAERVGVPRERRPYVAHLTVGRVRSDRNLRRLTMAIDEQREVPLGAAVVGSFVLYESTLGSAGPVYESLANFVLGG